MTRVSFSVAKAERDRLEAEMRAAATVLRAFPASGPMGLTPDSVKATEEWKMARGRFAIAFDNLRRFNLIFTKAFAAELREERRARQEEKLASI